MGVIQALILLTSTIIVSGQRPFFAGSRPIGFPELQNKTTTPSGLEDKFGEGTTQRLPIEANGDRELIDRLSKLPIDQQPFWFINWQALEAQREKPQTYPQRPNPFLQDTNIAPQIQNTNVNPSLGVINSNPGLSNANASPSPVPGSIKAEEPVDVKNSSTVDNRYGNEPTSDPNSDTAKPLTNSGDTQKPVSVQQESITPNTDNKYVQKPTNAQENDFEDIEVRKNIKKV